jgi:hypothetical protein
MACVAPALWMRKMLQQAMKGLHRSRVRGCSITV